VLLQGCELQNQQPHQGKKPDSAPRAVPRKVGRPRSCVEGSSAEVARGAGAIESSARITRTVQLALFASACCRCATKRHRDHGIIAAVLIAGISSFFTDLGPAHPRGLFFAFAPSTRFYRSYF
jgi:hypothetical protein